MGDGQHVEVEECPRKKLQGELIKYLTPVGYPFIIRFPLEGILVPERR